MEIIDRSYNRTELKSVVLSVNTIGEYVSIFDIDMFFKTTNTSFAKLLDDLGLNSTFDFSSRDNKRLYTHEFIKNICDFVKNSKRSIGKFIFYSNILTKDPFRNSIIKKMKSIFGFQIWEEAGDFNDFVGKIDQNDGNTVPKLEVLFDNHKKPKNLKMVKRHLTKMGLSYLNDIYFEDVSNKISIVG